jgi:hypothetical protein
MIFDFARSGCGKRDSTGTAQTISHACDYAKANGCPRLDENDEFLYVSDAYAPDGGGETTTCSSTATPAFINMNQKCDTVPDRFVMCQYGKPGDALGFIVKDGNDKGNTGDFITYGATTTNPCSPFIQCDVWDTLPSNVFGACMGSPGGKERIWRYTIPAEYCTSCPSTGLETDACKVDQDCSSTNICGKATCEERDGKKECVTSSDPLKEGTACVIAYDDIGNSCYDGNVCSVTGNCEPKYLAPAIPCGTEALKPVPWDDVCYAGNECVSANDAGLTQKTTCTVRTG